MKQTYVGGCHCGAVRYEATLDLSQGTAKCNCSICRKGRAWLASVGTDDFRLLSAPDALSSYQFGARIVHHQFCKTCGIKSFARVNPPDRPGFFVVVVSCLENVPDADLAALPVIYLDGHNDNFSAPPAHTAHL
jgi:hypothetical protein